MFSSMRRLKLDNAHQGDNPWESSLSSLNFFIGARGSMHPSTHRPNSSATIKIYLALRAFQARYVGVVKTM